MLKKVQNFISKAKGQTINYFSLIGKRVSPLFGKIISLFRKRSVLVTYFAVLIILLLVISLGIWPGSIMPEKEVPMEEKENDAINIFESEKELEFETGSKDKKTLPPLDKALDKEKELETKEKEEREDTSQKTDEDMKVEAKKEEDDDEIIVTSAEDIPYGLWPVEGDLITEHGEVYQVNNQYKIHKGIDIRSPKGSGVKAVWNGKVKEALKRPGMGFVVVLEHQGFESEYGNLKELLVEEGEQVNAGDDIAIVGDEAKLDAAKGSFLHFSVYSEKGYFDPLKLIE